ncbi:MAG TPA: chorismate mutase [Kiloniellaceae bacterium]|nr:chorismate mutase [Kiloniellaceae bacterium]
MGSAATSKAAESSDNEAGAAEALAPLRRKIDALDREIVGLLAKRFQVVRQVAALKTESGIAVRLPGRIEEVCARVAEQGGREGLDPDFLRQLYRQIIEEACALEDRLIADHSAETLRSDR